MGDAPENRLTVTFHNIAVEVGGLGEDYVSTAGSVVAGILPKRGSKGQPTDILQGVSGQVCPGEMLLVLGRPGSGCTSLLKILRKHRDEFLNVRGKIFCGNVGLKEAQKFRHQMVMNMEDDVHFPALKGAKTLAYATATKTPGFKPDGLKDEKAHVTHTTEEILTSLGINHTKDTMVGNEFARGVSGGERKRVSLVEVMATQAPFKPGTTLREVHEIGRALGKDGVSDISLQGSTPAML